MKFRELYENLLNESKINTIRGRIYNYLYAKYNEDNNLNILKTLEDIIDDFINEKGKEFGDLIEELQNIENKNDLLNWLKKNKIFSR